MFCKLIEILLNYLSNKLLGLRSPTQHLVICNLTTWSASWWCNKFAVNLIVTSLPLATAHLTFVDTYLWCCLLYCHISPYDHQNQVCHMVQDECSSMMVDESVSASLSCYFGKLQYTYNEVYLNISLKHIKPSTYATTKEAAKETLVLRNEQGSER